MNLLSRKAKALNFASSGSEKLDELLGGGFPAGSITHLYGPPSSGKTNIAMSAAVNSAASGKAIYLDTEGGFHLDRLRQILPKPELAKNILLKQLYSFKEQKSVVSQLQRFVDYKCRLIVLDSAVSLYRLENSGSRGNMLDNSRELGRQMAQLSKIARQNQVPIIVCNQVYESFRKKGSVEPVGRDVMAYWSKTALELGRKGSSRWARLARHPSKKAGDEYKFKIHNEGISKA